MSDSRLRELERRWRDTGSVNDEVSYLQERARVGDVQDEQLILAALFGSPAARVAIGESLEFRPPSSVADMVSLLLDIGPAALVRAALIAARLQFANAPTDFGKRAVKALEDLLNCPCPEHREAATELSREARSMYEPHEHAPDTQAAKSVWTEFGGFWFALETAIADRAHQSWDDGTTWRNSKTWRRRHAVWPTRLLEVVARTVGLRPLFDALSAELVPWILRRDWVNQ